MNNYDNLCENGYCLEDTIFKNENDQKAKAKTMTENICDLNGLCRLQNKSYNIGDIYNGIKIWTKSKI